MAGAQLLKHEVRLDRFSLLVFPGGFSYGDYIASGRILANEVRHNLRDDITRFHADGKLVLGICNGFQVLVKLGLLPAFDALFEPQSVTLDSNDSARYEDRWVWLAVDDSPCIFTRDLEQPIQLPVAHAEGKFLCRDAAVLQRLKSGRQVALRYVTRDGEPASFPENPNGSVDGIAGICDPSGRIFGLMPHPERFVRREHHPSWQGGGFTRVDGIQLFKNAVNYAKTSC
jgi:phosphoribosylformylglycinamidine synthase I